MLGPNLTIGRRPFLAGLGALPLTTCGRSSRFADTAGAIAFETGETVAQDQGYELVVAGNAPQRHTSAVLSRSGVLTAATARDWGVGTGENAVWEDADGLAGGVETTGTDRDLLPNNYVGDAALTNAGRLALLSHGTLLLNGSELVFPQGNIGGGMLVDGDRILVGAADLVGSYAKNAYILGFDAATGEQGLKPITLSAGENPTAWAKRLAENELVVLLTGNEGNLSPSLLVLDATSLAIKRQISLPADHMLLARSLKLSPDGNYAYIPTVWGEGVIFKVNLNSGYETDQSWSKDLGTLTQSDVLISGGRAYVTSYYDGNLHVLDAETFVKLASLQAPGNLLNLVTSVDGFVLVVGSSQVFTVVGP